MLTRVACPACQASFNAPENLLGKTVRCPACKKPFPLPKPEPEPEADPVIEQVEMVTEETDEPVRKKRRADSVDELASEPARASGVPVLLLAGIGGGVFLLFVLVGGLLAWSYLGANPSPNPPPDLAQNTNNTGQDDNTKPPEKNPEPPTKAPTKRPPIKEPPVIEPPLRKGTGGTKEPMPKEPMPKEPMPKEPMPKEPNPKTPPGTEPKTSTLPFRPRPAEPKLPVVPTLKEEMVVKSNEPLPKGATHRFGTITWRLPYFTEAMPSADGKEIHVLDSDRPPRFLDATTGKVLRDGPKALGQGVLTPDGRYFLQLDFGKGWNQLEFPSGKMLRMIPQKPDIFGATAFSRDGKLAALRTNEGSKYAVEMIDLESGQKLGTVQPIEGRSGMAFSPDGKILATLDPRGGGAFWDVSTGMKKAGFRTEPNNGLNPLSFTADGKYLFFSVFSSVVVWDVAANKEHHHYPVERNVLEYAPDGSSAVIRAEVDREPKLILINPLTGEKLRTLLVG